MRWYVKLGLVGAALFVVGVAVFGYFGSSLWSSQHCDPDGETSHVVCYHGSWMAPHLRDIERRNDWARLKLSAAGAGIGAALIPISVFEWRRAKRKERRRSIAT
ncbi:hypothetical protein [Nocardia arthritidis]|uniref:Uncharacterized protein n=1 Tax=Nocardia arthritidis TaxID=228602 RepID=A0A6G9YAR1_9NOCA|nr:hypothetical protein [Nocardia arthritidis]QIS10133.1 hypothetical protein F5544_11195 [Nocardia arthritidis]